MRMIRNRSSAREIDFAKGVFVAKGKKILTVSEKLAGALTLNLNHGFRVSDKYDFYFSGDSSLLAVMYRLKPYKHSDKNYHVIGMHVLDADLNEKWSKKVQMPYTEKAMSNLSYSVDGLGNVYFVSRVFDDNTKSDEEDTKYQLKIFKVASGSGVISSTEVGVKDKFVQSVWLYEISEKGTMMCAGLYSNRDDKRDTDGIILFRFGQDGTLANLNLIEIPLEVLNQNVKGYDRRKNERKEGEDEAAFSNLKLEQVIKQPDAGLLIVGEKQYMKTRSDANGNTYMTSHADDILVTKVDAYGKLVWMKKLPKRQRSGSSNGGLSYRYFQQSSAHHFLVLDNEKNLDLTETRVPALYIDDGEDGLLTTYEINDKTGNVKKQLILDTRNVNGVELLRFSPTRFVSPLPNTLIFEAYKKKKEDVLIKIEF